jgi:FlaG/FlaF family flagellin (archaellin)
MKRFFLALLVIVLLAAALPFAFHSPQSVSASYTTVFAASSSDGYIVNSGLGGWTSVLEGVTGVTNSSSSSIKIEASYTGGGAYQVSRGLLYFNTASIPAGATITGVSLGFYYISKVSDYDYLEVLQGWPTTIPHDPMISSDFFFANYNNSQTELYAERPVTDFHSGYNAIDLSSSFYSKVSRTGTTKICLEMGYDYTNIRPSEVISVTIGSAESGHPANLLVTWIAPAAVTTDPVVTNVTETSVTLRGNVTTIGSDALDWRGFFYGPTPSFGSEWNDTTSATGAYDSGANITGLTLGGTFYYEAAVHSSQGWEYGSVYTFTLLNYPTLDDPYASGISTTTATLNGNISNIGGATNTQRGFVYGLASVPDPGHTDPTGYGSGYTYPALIDAVNITSAPSVFTHDLDGLTEDTTYYFRACTYNSVGWVYSSQQSFTTAVEPTIPEPLPISSPEVSTSAATSVDDVSALLHGSVDSVNNDNVTIRGFQYSTDFSFSDNITDTGGPWEAETYSLSLTSLTPGTTYNFRAIAVNSAGAGYGSAYTFTTIPEDPSSLSVDNTTYSTATLSWTKGAHADRTLIRYSTTSYPAIPTSGIAGYFGTDNTCIVSSLTPSTLYYFSAFSWTGGVYSTGYATATGTTGTPPPTNFKADDKDFSLNYRAIHFWWTVPEAMTGSATSYTVIHAKIGSYPTSPVDIIDIVVYDQLTGDPGVNYYTWDIGVLSGTPYFFTLWFYNSSDSSYTDPLNISLTTPAVAAGFIWPTDNSTQDFTDMNTSHITGMPGYEIGTWVASTMNMENGWFYGLIALILLALLSAFVAIMSGSVAVTFVITVAGYILLMASLGLAYWWLVVYVIFAFSIAYVKGGANE